MLALELERCRVVEIDWNKVIVDLSAQGISMAMIAKALAVSPRVVENWKNRGHRPRYEQGAALLEMRARFARA